MTTGSSPAAGAPAPPPAKRDGLPRAFVALCVGLGVLVGVYCVLMLLSIATASTEHRTRTFRAVGELRIDGELGAVTIVGERRDDIRVEMEIQRGMWRGAWQPEVSVQPRAGRLRLGSDCSLWAHVGVSDCGASFTIHVPRATRIVVDAGSGEVRVAGLTGAVEVRSSSGDVEAERIGGPLALQASSGDVTVDAYGGDDVTARAGSGDVEVRTLRAPRRLHAEAGSGDVTVAVPAARYRVETDTGSGDEDVQVVDDPRATRLIVAKAGSGDVTVLRLAP